MDREIASCNCGVRYVVYVIGSTLFGVTNASRWERKGGHEKQIRKMGGVGQVTGAVTW